MNLAETSDLLAFLARCDNRRIDDATVIAWQSILPDLPIRDCLAAAREHYAANDAYLMPVHIRRGAEAIDRERRKAAREAREAEEERQLSADPTRRDRSAEVSEIINRLRCMLPDGHPDQLRRPEMLAWDRAKVLAERADQEPNPHYDPQVALRARMEAEADVP